MKNCFSLLPCYLLSCPCPKFPHPSSASFVSLSTFSFFLSCFLTAHDLIPLFMSITLLFPQNKRVKQPLYTASCLNPLLIIQIVLLLWNWISPSVHSYIQLDHIAEQGTPITVNHLLSLYWLNMAHLFTVWQLLPMYPDGFHCQAVAQRFNKKWMVEMA